MSSNGFDNDYPVSQQRKFEDASDNYLKEANETFRELLKQLLLIGSVLLPVSVFVFNSQGLFNKLLYGHKVLLTISWGSLGFSMLFGIIQFIVDYYYFRKKSNINYEIADIVNKDPSITSTLSNGSTRLDKIAIEKQKAIPNESSLWCVKIQFALFVLGMMVIVGVMMSVLWK